MTAGSPKKPTKAEAEKARREEINRRYHALRAQWGGHPTYDQIREAFPNLCWAPCGVPSKIHPGMHINLRGSDEGMPVCLGDIGHPGGHFCCIEDARRFGQCPRCSKWVAKRVLARHVKAHDNDGKTEEQIKRERYAPLVVAIEAWIQEHGDPWAFVESRIYSNYGVIRKLLRHELADRYVASLRQGKPSSFWAKALREERKVSGKGPPTGVKEIGKTEAELLANVQFLAVVGHVRLPEETA